MKYKFHSQIKPSLVTLLIFLSISFISAENMKAQVKVLNKRLRVDDYYERPIIIPNQHYHHDNRRRIQGPPNIFRQQENTQILPLIRNRPQNMYQPIENCPCINEVKCPPCGVVFEPSSSICPCAPKPNCPVCPPLSLIHEIAAKKAKQDQIFTSNLIGLSKQISSLLTNITKYANDIAKYELEAKAAARKMEEASLKAQFAKKKMYETSEKARIIAKSTLYPTPCLGCPPGHLSRHRSINPMWYGTFNRIFPEEVNNVNKYLSENYNSNYNLNGNNLLSQGDELAKLAEGKINVLPLGVKSTSINLSKKKKKIKL